MLRKAGKKYFFLEGLGKVLHGFSSREFGDCHVHQNPACWSNLEKFLQALGIKRKDLVLMEQIHGRRVKKISASDKRKIIKGVDGLVTQEKGVFLGIKTADCLPLLFYDPEAKIVGAAHAGWQGIAKGVQQKVVEVMIKMGSVPSDILVGVGPAICDRCHFQTPPLIQEKTLAWRSYLHPKNGKIRVEITRFCLDRLMEMGILKRNIFQAKVCTKENWDQFFSYKAAQEKGKEKEEGRFISVIGMV